jgi:protein phosphatase
MSSRSVKNLLVTALDNANTRVFDLAQASDALMGMGTTVVAAIVSGRKACIAHAGDSRAYLLFGDELLQLTKDHSVVQVMVDTGQITEDEARHHPRKNLITRVLGVAETLEADYCEEELPPGSVLLLCTDGLTNCVEPDEFPALLKQNGFANFADDLVLLANERGGQDNITVVAIEI